MMGIGSQKILCLAEKISIFVASESKGQSVVRHPQSGRSSGSTILADKWEGGVYTVIGVNPSVHVYTIQDAVGHTKGVHRNLLLEVIFLPLPGMDQGKIAHARSTNDESDQEDCVSDDEMASLS